MEAGVIVTVGIRLIEKQASNQLKEERVYYFIHFVTRSSFF